MKKIDLDEKREFNPIGIKNNLLHDSAYFKIINFNIAAGQLFPVHSHDIEGQLSALVIEGEGEFLNDDEAIADRPLDDRLNHDPFSVRLSAGVPRGPPRQWLRPAKLAVH